MVNIRARCALGSLEGVFGEAGEASDALAASAHEPRVCAVTWRWVRKTVWICLQGT